MPKTVLLADDNATIHRLVELTFAGQDIRVQAVATGDQAIEAIERSAPDLVLADVGLPARSGYEVAQFVRSQSRLSSVPVLLVSGVLDQVDSARAQQVGADGVLTKPFDPAVLVARVTELLSGGRGRRGTAMPIESRAPQRPQTPQTPQTVPAPQSPPTAVNAAPAPTPLAAPTPGDAAQPIDSASPPLDAVSPAMPKADVPLDPSVPDERKADVDRYFEEIDRAFAELSKLPGVGQRTAQRLAFHLLRAPDEEAFALGEAIREVKEKVGLCEECFNLAEGPLCRICSDPSRDRSIICVVEEPADVIPIERTHEYRGLYHVLGGALSPIDGVDAQDLKIAELLSRVQRGGIGEVVLATNPTTTGEATALHIAEALRGQVTVTRLASGLPVGADLEHADEVTLGKALAGRRSLD